MALIIKYYILIRVTYAFHGWIFATFLCLISMFSDKKIVIIGGGPSGCSAAAQALKSGFQQVVVLESSMNLGGLHKDIEINGLHFDLGAFFFWNHHQILKLFPGVRQYLVYAESSRHLSLSDYYHVDQYPLTLKGYVNDHGWADTLIDFLKLLWQRVTRPQSEFRNAEELLLHFMGPFYRKTGLDNYIKRLFYMEPTEIHTDFAYKRLYGVIGKFKSKNILENIFRFDVSYFTNYKIVQDVWARPESGFNVIYEHIRDEIVAAGGEIRCNSRVVKINYTERSIELDNGEILKYDYLLSSQPLQATSHMTGIEFNIRLDYQPLCSLFYEVAEEPIPECFVLFNFTRKGKWKRITFHSNYYNRHKGVSSNRYYFVVESMPAVHEVSNPDLATQLDVDFRATFQNTKWSGTLANATLLGSQITKNAYPIFNSSFDRKKVTEFHRILNEWNIYNIGRQGEFDHVSSSDASKSALLAVDLICQLASKDNIISNAA